jgi:hypothetical protein
MAGHGVAGHGSARSGLARQARLAVLPWQRELEQTEKGTAMNDDMLSHTDAEAQSRAEGLVYLLLYSVAIVAIVAALVLVA